MFSSYRDKLNNNYISYVLDPQFSEFKISYLGKFLTLFKKMINIKIMEFFTGKKTELKKSSDKPFFDLEKNEKITRAKKRVNQQYLEESISQKSAFNYILDICVENDIELFLIKFPLSEEYINERNVNENYIEFKKKGQQFSCFRFFILHP